MLRRALKALSLATGAVLLGLILTVVSAVTPPNATDVAASAAVSTSSFDPGFIISDSVMFDFGTMNVAAIQSFLNSKVATCSANASAPCLKSYTSDTHDIAPVANRCLYPITGAKAQTAAQIIYTVAQACRVNPKVLLVTLQKEQGLVTATSPTAGKYKIAMGYGCPDTAPCDSQYYGFFNQVYQAAYAFNKYTKSPDQYTAYQPGVRRIAYNPKSSCGTVSVKIQTKATGALYFYTPYTPNAAALANPSGVGDGCSSYGNRNFWVYFTTWFGSPVGGSFVIDTADGHTYVLVNGAKWELPASRPALRTTLSSFGAVGRVSSAYASSFPTGGTFANLVTDSHGNLFLLDSGRRYTLTGCAQATDFGFSCASVPTFSDDMLNVVPVAGALSSTVTTSSGATFLLGGGVKREVLDAASLAAANIGSSPASPLLDDTLAGVPYAAPIARTDAPIAVRGSSDQLVVTPSATYRLSATLLSEARLGSRFGSPAGALDAASTAFLPAQVAFHGVWTNPATGRAYVLTKAGAASVTDPKEWGTAFPTVDPAFTARIAAAGKSYSAPIVLKNLTSSRKTLLKSDHQRPVSTNAQLRAIAKAAHASTTALSLSGETVALLGTPLVKPGTLITPTKKATTLWIVDGGYKKRSVSSAQAIELRGSTKATVVSKATVDGYTTVTGSAKPGLRAAGHYYVADKGILREVSATDAKRYGSKFGFGSYDPTTIAALKHGAPIGRVITYSSKYYEITSGKKKHISSAVATKLAQSSGKKTQAVTKYLAGLLPTK
ncbi:hypothetical protein BH11ACT2_BH11ACT2_08440 [soil metagenome]